MSLIPVNFHAHHDLTSQSAEVKSSCWFKKKISTFIVACTNIWFYLEKCHFCLALQMYLQSAFNGKSYLPKHFKAIHFWAVNTIRRRREIIWYCNSFSSLLESGISPCLHTESPLLPSISFSSFLTAPDKYWGKKGQRKKNPFMTLLWPPNFCICLP